MKSFTMSTAQGDVTVTHAPTAGVTGRWTLAAPWSEPNPVVGTEGEIQSYVARRAVETARQSP